MHGDGYGWDGARELLRIAHGGDLTGRDNGIQWHEMGGWLRCRVFRLLFFRCSIELQLPVGGRARGI